jgi:hypothetical protein
MVANVLLKAPIMNICREVSALPWFAFVQIAFTLSNAPYVIAGLEQRTRLA